MTRSQPAVVHYALKPLAVELREVPVPAIGDEDVLLAVGAVSVCGSDVHQAHNTHSWPVEIPVTLGHEFCGTVAAVGSRVRGFKEGDRVVSETAAIVCGECRMCRSGLYNLCPSRKGFGYGVDGAMAEYVRVPARCLHHIPDSLPFDLACLTEPHAVAYNAMCVNVTVRPGDTVVVLGPGPIGLLCARMAALSGADPLIVVGRSTDRDRIAVARELGATHVASSQDDDVEALVRDLAPLGADVVCDASGSTSTTELSVKLARPDGQIVKVGWSPESQPINLNPLVHKNVRLQGSFSHNWPIWERVIRLLASGATRAEHIVGFRTSLEDWRAAFDAMHEGRVIKSVLVVDETAQDVAVPPPPIL
ncbi:MAG TPA: zinc-binding dehydrogenase [Vicinamibacterales bacterium]|nr:zinc-binding dehydrogenase [Vicinamibacterales bacterium]